MPKQSFAFEAGEEKRLGISWKGTYRNVNVSLDGNSIGIITDKKALSIGQEFHLADGTTIKVQLVDNIVSTELQVLRNGKPLPGSDSDPQTRLKRAYQTTFVGAIVWFGISLLYALFNRDSSWMDEGFPLLLFGFVFLAAGFLIRRKSVLALVLAIIVWLVIGILSFVIEDSPSIVRVVLRVFYLVLYLVPLYTGFGAIQTLKNEGT